MATIRLLAIKGVHPVPLGPWPPALCIIGTKDAYRRFCRARRVPDPPPFPKHGGGHCQKLLGPNGMCVFLIAVDVAGQEGAGELAATLAHEATHAMRWIFEHVGERQPGTEAQAYMVEHIVRTGMAALADA